MSFCSANFHSGNVVGENVSVVVVVVVVVVDVVVTTVVVVKL